MPGKTTIGRMRERVTIRSTWYEKTSSGGRKKTTADVATVWARAEMLAGTETVRDGQVESRLTHRVTIRYRTDLTPQMELSWRDRTLEVMQVVPDERHEMVALLCNEVVKR